MAIPWFYIFSPKYEIFHHILYNSLSECSGFQVHPCFFEQSAFERIRVKVKDDEHFFSGNSLKFRMLLDKLKTMSEGAPFVISDADVYIPNATKFHSICLAELDKHEITGMAEHIGDTKSVNIGILLCKNTSAVRGFLTHLAEQIEATGGQDQLLFNNFYPDWPIRVGLFPLPDVIQSNMFDFKTDFAAIQFLCSSNDSTKNIVSKLISACYFLDLTGLLFLLPKAIVIELIEFYKIKCPDNPICRYTISE